jgi:hypothetical protein
MVTASYPSSRRHERLFERLASSKIQGLRECERVLYSSVKNPLISVARRLLYDLVRNEHAGNALARERNKSDEKETGNEGTHRCHRL